MLEPLVTLEEKLRALHLINSAERYPIFSKQAGKDNLSYEKFLEQLLDEELEGRSKRAVV